MSGKNGLVRGWLPLSLTSMIESLTNPKNQLSCMTYLKSSGPLCLIESNLLTASPVCFVSQVSCRYLRYIPLISIYFRFLFPT